MGTGRRGSEEWPEKWEHLEVTAQNLVDHQLHALHLRWEYIWGRAGHKHRPGTLAQVGSPVNPAESALEEPTSSAALQPNAPPRWGT